MGATNSSETSADVQRTARFYISENINLVYSCLQINDEKGEDFELNDSNHPPNLIFFLGGCNCNFSVIPIII
jgi:hypothetical protein